jgi:replicative DNA helicase
MITKEDNSSYIRHFNQKSPSQTSKNFLISQSQRLKAVTKTLKCPIIERSNARRQEKSEYYLFPRSTEPSETITNTSKAYHNTSKSREAIQERNVRAISWLDIFLFFK